MVKLYFTSISLLFSCFLWAGGFQVNLQGVRNTSMGHCGTALKLGASSGFFNPGALAFTSSEITGGVSLVRANVTYREFAPGDYVANNLPGLGTPINFHASWKIKETGLVLGASVYNPFGSSIAYDDEWKGRFLLREMSLRTFFYQGTVSYQINEKWGVGAAYVFGTGDFSLRRALPLQFTDGSYGSAELSGSGSGHGFNAGIFYQANEKWAFGLSFRSGMAVALENGTTNFSVPSAVQDQFPADNSFTTNINLPGVANFGASYQMNESLTLALDVNYVMWSSYDSLKFDFETNTDNLSDLASAREYQNAFIFRIGAEWKTKDWLTVRSGAYYDMTPVQDGYLTPETPDTDKVGISLGGTVHFTEKIHLDLSLLYVTGSERSDINNETEFSGTWQSGAVISAIGFTYNF